METPSFSSPPLAPDAVRGRYLPRHRARIIERGNLLLVEFLDPPTAAVGALRPQGRARASFLRLPAWHIALLWGVSLSALALEVLRLL